MLNLKIVGASLLLGASTVALAQETEENGIGGEVSVMAQDGMPVTDPAAFAAHVQALATAQRPENVGGDELEENGDVEGQSHGIGASVSAMAQGGMPVTDPAGFAAEVQALATAQRPENAGGDDVEENGDVEGESMGIGTAVSADAQLQGGRTVEERTAFGAGVVARTPGPAADRAAAGLSAAANARLNGVAAVGDVRAAASANRADVTQIRSTATAARGQAQAAASTARNIRATISVARPGRGGR